MGVLNPTTFTILTYRAFEPTEISGLKGWWKADSINQADNTSVSAWLDSSGNEAHMYQSSATAQPTLQTNELNGYPVVRFDGTNDFMNLTAPFDVQPTNTGSLNSTAVSVDGNYLAHANSSTSPYFFIYKKNGNDFNKLSNPSTLPTGTVNSINFSNDSNYLSVPSSLSPFIQNYKRTGDTFSVLSNPANLPTGNSYFADWSHDDSLLIVAHVASPFITIYSVNKTTDTFTKLANPASLPSGNSFCAKFSTNSSFVGVSVGPSPYIEFYSNSSGVLTKLSNPATLPTGPINSISWFNDTTCAIGQNASNTILIYQYNNTNFELLTSFSVSGATQINAIAYSRNKNYLAVSGNNSPYIRIYSVSGTTYTALSNPSSLPLGTGRGVAWGLNDNFLLVSHTTSPFIQAYTFDGTTLTNLTKLNMFRNVGGGTMVAVVKPTALSAIQYYAFIMRGGSNTVGSRMTLGVNTTNNFIFGGRRLDADSGQVIGSTTTASSTYIINTGTVDYQNRTLKLFVNGKQESTTTTFQTSGNSQDTDSVVIKFGASELTSANFFNGDIAEVIIFNRTLSTAEIRDVHYYLSAKYGITLAT